MSLYEPAYRLTVFAPYTTDPSETTALSPAGSSIHTDSFKVATMQGVSGFQPYLGMPEGRKSRYNPMTGRVDIGALTFRLLDKRTSTSNLQRWVTAFVGNTSGKANLVGRRVVVEESMNGGDTWSPFYCGRIESVQLDDVLWYSITVREPTDELQWMVFNNAPYSSTTGIAHPSMLPLGLSARWDVYGSSSLMTGTYERNSETQWITVDPSISSLPFFPQLIRPKNIATTAFLGELQKNSRGFSIYGDSIVNQTGGTNTAQYHVVITSGSIVQRHMPLRSVTVRQEGTDDQWIEVVQMANPLNSSHPKYLATSSLANDSTVQFRIVPANKAASETHPIFINAHPAQIMYDMCRGYYGRLTVSGQPVRAMKTDDSAFSTLLADNSFDRPRFKITKPMKVSDFLDKYLSQYGISYRIEPRTSGSAVVPYVVPFDSRLPTSVAGLTTITDSDLSQLGAGWELGKPLSSLTIKYWNDVEVYDKDIKPDVVPWLIEEAQSTDRRLYADNADGSAVGGGEDMTIDALGLRITGWTADGGVIPLGENYRTPVQRMQDYVDSRFAYGPPTAVIYCRRTSNVESVQVGQWVFLEVSHLPDLTSHARGGTRLMQVTERTERGHEIEFRLLDSGRNVVATAPSFGTCTTGTPSTNTLVIPISTADNQQVRIDIASEPITGSIPSETSAKWHTVVTTKAFTSSSVTYTLNAIPSNRRNYIRARTTEPNSRPSAWTFPSPTYVDTTALTAVTSLTYSDITPHSAFLSWSNAGDETSQIEVKLASPSSSALIPVAVLPAASTEFYMEGLSSGSSDNPHKIQLHHVDSFGGSSDGTFVTFTTSGSLSESPDLVGFWLYGSTTGITVQ